MPSDFTGDRWERDLKCEVHNEIIHNHPEIKKWVEDHRCTTD